MFVRTLEVHWKVLRWPLAILAVVAFAAPLLWAGPTGAVMADWDPAIAARFWNTGTLQTDGNQLFPFLAVAAGALAALGVWYPDHDGDHVFALSLPVSRTRYVLTKFGAGFALLLPVAVAFLAGALVALAGLDLPDWLHGRPFGTTFRFLLGATVVYSLLFALAAGTIPTTLKTLVALGVVAILVPALPLFVDASGSPWFLRAAELLYHALYEWPGPFAVLTGGWSLLGV
jgi:hypothetical protein